MYQELGGKKQNQEMGYVYVLLHSESNLVKIGKTTDPQKRFRTLANQTGSKLKYHITPAIYKYSLLEKVMLNRFDRYRVKGEWLKGCTFEEVVNSLNEIVNCDDFKRRNVAIGSK